MCDFVSTLCLKRTMSKDSLSVGMFHRPSSIHLYAMFSAMRKLAWAFVSNLRAVCSISTKQAF